MPVWWVSEPFINLRLEDEPLGYQPSHGPRVSFHLSYRQRGSMDEDPYIFGIGTGWTSSLRWYVFVDPNGYLFLHQGGAGLVSYYVGQPQRRDGSVLSDIVGMPGYAIRYTDGSIAYFRTPATNSAGFTYYFLSTMADPAGNCNTYGYTTNSGIFQLTSVTDPDGNVTSLNYTNSAFANQITSVVDPFFRTNYLTYDANGYLTNSIDVAGISSTFVYDAGNPGWITNLVTPYGATGFSFGGVDANKDLSASDPGVDRYALITLPTGGKHLYLYQNDCSSFLGSWAPTIPSTAPFSNTFEQPADRSYPYWNSFYWGPKQYETLSTHDPTMLTDSDYANGRMRHWLKSDANQDTTPSTALSIERAPSPDGTTQGQLTWYDYENKVYDFVKGGISDFPSFVAQVLPDGTTNFSYSLRNGCLNVTNNVSTYTANGAAALRTNIYYYAANAIDLQQWIGPDGEQVVSNYFSLGNYYHEPDASYDALNEATLYTYNTGGQITSIQNPAGLTTTNNYNTSGAGRNRLATTIDLQINRTNSYTYYSNGLLDTHTDERGLTTTSFWDNLQRLTGMSYPDGTTTSNLYTYLDVTGTKDRLGYWTYAGYNAIRQKIAETNADGAVTGYSYCDCGLLYSVTNAWNTTAQMVTSYDYDNQGNRQHTYLPDATNSYVYDALGRVATNSDAWGSHYFGYNNQGLLIGNTNAYGTEKLIYYDIEDRPIHITDANQVTVTNSYDLLGRLNTRLYPDGGMEEFGYSPRGLVAYTNQLNLTNFYGYDAASRKTAETNANGEILRYTNNAAGDLLSLTDGKNQTTLWNYDTYGRVTSKLDQTGTEVLSYNYNADSRLTNRWSAAKGNTTYTYDPVGNLTYTYNPTGPTVYYQYDPLNRLTNMVDEVGTTAFAYTSGGELYTETGPFASDTVTNTYWNRMRLGLGLQQPTGAWTNGFAYDAAKRLVAVGSPAGDFYYYYDPVRLLSPIKVTLPNNSYITNVYDENARLLSTKLLTSSASVLDAALYGYNAGNQRTTFTNAAGTYVDYSYDPAGQLKVAASSVSTENRGYAYDPAWNLNSRTNNGTPTTFSVDGKNQLTSVGSASYAYDSNGNLTTQSTSSTGYSYDSENRLTSVQYVVGISTKETTFAYDGLGRLREQLQWTYSSGGGSGQVVIGGGVKPDTGGGGGGGTWTLNSGIYYIYDGNRVIQERDTNDNPTVSYTRGNDLSGSLEGAGGIGGLLARSDSYSGGNFTDTNYYHADGIGNITYLETASQGLAASYRYDAFGNTLASSGTYATANTYRFSSKEYMSSAGLYYYLYRFYNPNLQRWLNRDPLGEPGFEVMQRAAPYRAHSLVQGPAERIEGPNLYEYVRNNPIQYVDPLGLQVPPQVIQEIDEILSSPEAQAEEQAAETELATLMQQARDLYPKLCNKFQWHHITPKYLGGDPNGPLVLLEGPYHQLITNAFRNQWAYGQGVPPSTTVVNIVNTVYSQLPLPK
jgi:RHS repeat-associated protein